MSEYLTLKKCDREAIVNKSDAIKALEEDHVDIKLNFEYKTLYLKRIPNTHPDFHTSWYWSKTYYEISYLSRGEKKFLKFYSKKGYKTLEFYLIKAFYSGGDKEE